MKLLNIHTLRGGKGDNHMHTIYLLKHIFFRFPCILTGTHWAIAFGLNTLPLPLSLCFSFSFSFSLTNYQLILSFSPNSSGKHNHHWGHCLSIKGHYCAMRRSSEHCLEQQQPCPLASFLFSPFHLVKIEFKYKGMKPNASTSKTKSMSI